MKNVCVSIIVPVYNVEKYLERCVNSLLSQTLEDIEIILVDDGSSDNSSQICDNYALIDSRIKVIHKTNAGLGFARNSGLELAKGEYVTFIDSDDYVEPETYEFVYKDAKKNNLDVCYFKYRRVNELGNKIEVSLDKSTYYFYGEDDVRNFMLNLVGKDPTKLNQSFFSMSVCMGLFRLSTIKDSQIRFVSERLVASEDLIFHIQYLPHVNAVGVLPNVFYNYFINTASISTTYDSAKYDRMIKLLCLVKDELLRLYEWKLFKNHYYSQQLRIIKIFLSFESKMNINLKDKIRIIKKHCKESCFKELYSDAVIREFSFKDRLIVFLMKYQIILPLIFIYKKFK